jgi:methylmalonyl-CoA mutase N-terminal domain/subunit
MVGVNRYREGAHASVEILKIPSSVETKQIRFPEAGAQEAGSSEHRRVLDELLQAAKERDEPDARDPAGGRSLRVRGEICATLKAPFGEYREEKTYF